MKNVKERVWPFQVAVVHVSALTVQTAGFVLNSGLSTVVRAAPLVAVQQVCCPLHYEQYRDTVNTLYNRDLICILCAGYAVSWTSCITCRRLVSEDVIGFVV
jgi:hypothetical protein